jgi:hypothetical protein
LWVGRDGYVRGNWKFHCSFNLTGGRGVRLKFGKYLFC